MTRPRSSSRTARSRPRLLRAAGALCLGLLAGAAEAIVTLPANVDLWHQTSGQQRCVNIGDWYTSQNSCGAGTIVGNPGEHTFVIRVPPSAVAGGPVDIVVLDAESVDGANDVDEVQGPPDPVRFWLEDENSFTIGDQTLEGGANGQSITFTVSVAGDYTLRTVTGSVPIPGDARTASNLNDDDNSWKLDLPTGAQVIFFESTLQHDRSGSLDVDLFFTVGPGVTGLQLRNFDADGGFSSLTYRRPSGTGVSGTESGNAEWNGSPRNVNDGADVISGLATGPGGADLGVWTIEVRGWNANNQAIFEVLDQNGNPLPVADDANVGGVTNSGSWSLAGDTSLTTDVNVAVDHPFTVTNDFTVADIVNFDVSGTLAGVTTELRIDGGAALTDTDGDSRPDTGLLAPGDALDLVLRVTGTAAGTDVTTVTGDSTVAGALAITPVTRDVVKTTVIDPVANLSTSTKTGVDENGGDLENGDTILYTITLTETAGVAVTGAQVVDDLDANLGSFLEVSLPAGASSSFAPTGGVNGTGQWTVTGIDVPASGSVTLEFRATVVGAGNGEDIDNAAQLTAPGITETLTAPTFVVAASSVPGSGNKRLYFNVDAADGIQRALPTIADPAGDTDLLFGGGASLHYALTPALADDLVIEGGTTFNVFVFVSVPNIGFISNGARTLEVTLAPSSSPASAVSDTTVVPAPVTRNQAAPALVQFDLQFPSDVTVPAGDTLDLTLTNDTAGAISNLLLVHARSGAFAANDLAGRSQVILPALTVVNVDAVGVFEAAAPATAVGVVSPGDDVLLRAVVSDPFGFEDISEVAFTVSDSNGVDVFTATSTTPVADNGAEEATFEVAYTPTGIGPEGFWTVAVIAEEGIEDDVEDLGVGTFELGLPDFLILKSSPQVFSDPVNGTSNPKRIPGAVVLYQIQVSNQGRGRADADSVAVTDNLPGGLELGVPPGGNVADAITFSDGATSSGLPGTLDVVYTLSSGTAPADGDSDGCYENVDGFVVTPTGRMNGAAPPAPSFTLSYRACVR